jgi:sec-independent protein translocase protein TatB
MLDFGWSQMALVAVVALLVLGPKELPKVIKSMSEWVGKARSLAREFRASVDDMVRESELKTVKEEFEQAAYKAEQEFSRDVDGVSREIRDATDIRSFETSFPTDASALPDPYVPPPEWQVPWPKLQPLADHERRKKAHKAKALAVYIARVVGAPALRLGPAGVRRKARPIR